MQLVYDATCPKCSRIKSAIQQLDRAGQIEYIDINSPRGERLVRDWHDGDYVYEPHLRDGTELHWGVKTVAREVVKRTPRLVMSV